ncbi:MAG: hypothetical protein GXP31_08305 [Kiritimatiellaeota bacterium]|nr:hypothetical protein [Kiritimatiellota bacterium]
MQEIGAPSRIRTFFLGRWRRLGAASALVFGVWSLLYIDLAVAGRLVTGHSARIPAEGIPDDQGPVLYFYRVNDVTYHGWRRGIQWGEQPLAIVYLGAWPRIHVTSLRPDLPGPSALWRDADFLLRLALVGCAFLASLGLMIVGPYLSFRFPGVQFLFPDRRKGPFQP